MLKRSYQVLSHRSAASLAAGLALLMLASCSSTPGFPSISTAETLEEIQFQRDAAVAKLQDTLDVVADERQFIRSLELEKNTTFEDLRRERAEFATLEAKLAESEARTQENAVQIEASQKELTKIRQTHSRLNRMAQETLGEVSALRQRGEDLEGEKQHYVELAQSRDRRITELSREIDNLRAEILRHATTVQVSRSEGERPPAVIVAVDSETGAVRTEETRAGNGDTTADTTGAAPRTNVETDGEGLVFGVLYDKTVTELQKRYARALEGEMAWDTFDIVAVSVLGGLVFCLIVVLVVYIRLRSLKKTVRRLRSQMRRKPRRSGVAVPERRASTVVEQPETRGNLDRDQPSPENFSPIFRSSAVAEEEDYEEEEYEDVVGTSTEMQTMMIQPEAESVDEDRSGRRVIGVFKADDSARYGSTEDDPVDSPSTTTAQAEATQDFLPAAVDESGDDFSATQMIPDSFLGDAPSQDPSPGQADAGGAHEEQELLDELKAIINKKLNS